MGYRVTVDGSGRTFEVHPGQALLAGALGAGVPAPYGCANGNCGECIAWVQSGEVEQVAHSDFAMTAADRQAGAILLCCSAPHSDLRLAMPLAHAAGDIEEQTITAKVTREEELGDGIRQIRMRAPRTQLLRYLSGQSVHLRLGGGEFAEMALASCPCEGVNLSVHYASDESLFAKAAARLGRGDRVGIRGPYGDFTLPEDCGSPLVLVSRGAGYGAVHGLLSQVVNLEVAAPVLLIRVCDDNEPPYLHNYCRSLNDALDNFCYHWGSFDAQAVGERVAEHAGAAPDVWVAAGAQSLSIGQAISSRLMNLGKLRLLAR
jgi:CDP-4-dehydro-6-deoxyglucose reductase